MPLDPVKIAQAVASGLSIVCSTCQNYWNAADRGASSCQERSCGSPISGDVFHKYSGPMSQFDRFCFVCGNQATNAIRVGSLVRVIGCCHEHVKLVQTLKPSMKEGPPVVLIDRNGEKSSAEKPKQESQNRLKIVSG